MTEKLRDYEDLEPCGDGGCIMLTAPARGMTTNGGCQHLKLDAGPMRRQLRRLAMERRRLTNETDALRAEVEAAHVAGFQRGCAYSRAECETVARDYLYAEGRAVAAECAERISALFREAERHGRR